MGRLKEALQDSEDSDTVEHFICRTAESDDSTRLSLSGSPNAMSGAMEGTSRRSPGTAALPLQLCKATPVPEVWEGSKDTGHAGWVGRQAANIQGDLLPGNA